jgi:hypothetical protein
MEDRGRKGTFDVIKPVATLPGQRLAPPASLGADEIETWRAIVASMPHDWFHTCHFLLRGLVAHIANAEVLSVAVAKMRATKDARKHVQEFNKLLAMLHRENQMIVNLSQKLRLVPRAKYTMERSTNIKSNVPQGPRPWDIRKGDDDGAA